MRLDINFIGNCKADIDNGYINRVCSYNINAKVIISYAAINNHPLKIINLGGGVKRLISSDYICPHCKGCGSLT